MNYDEARQLPNDGGWHWTTKNDGKVGTAWPCIEYVGPTTDPQWYAKPTKPEDWQRCEPHATKEDAERHYYDACLGNVTEHDSSHWMDCRKCGAATKKLLGNMELSYAFNTTPLCDEHRTKEVMLELHPFVPGIALAHS